MKHLIILANMLFLVAFDIWAYNETDLLKFEALGACEGCDLSGANLNGRYLQRANLNGSDLRGANLNDANLREADLQRANLNGADLRGAYLSGAILREADLTGANLSGANLRRDGNFITRTPGADLTGAILRGANLSGADLEDADLNGADLRGANLSGADLGSADLKDADLQRTNLKNANLTGTIYCKTKMPWGELNDDCESVTEANHSEVVTAPEQPAGPDITGPIPSGPIPSGPIPSGPKLILILLSVFISVLVCYYAKTLNRRPLIWFMISFGSSIPTFFIPLGPMICFGILVYKGRLPSKEELEELDFLIQDFLSLYEDKKDLAAKHVVMRNLYLRVNKDRSTTNKWEITNALNTLVNL